MNENELRDLLTRVSGRDLSKATLNDDLVETLDLDSLTALRMLAAVEKYGGVRFPDDQLDHYRTLGQIIDFVKKENKS